MEATKPTPARSPTGTKPARSKPAPGQPVPINPRRFATIRRHPVARKIILAWRRLISELPPGPTLLACSGGADSTAMLLAIGAASRTAIIAHIIHDLRPRPEALADRDSARNAAAQLGLTFVEAEVTPAREKGNKENAARRLRYRALARLAREHGCTTIATAHHADDQLESILIALIRGAGLNGLRGISARRPLAKDLTLIRPVLGITRAEARELCNAFGLTWREDETNRDTTRLRAALRQQVFPALEKLRPGASKRASTAAASIADAAQLVKAAAEPLLQSALVPEQGKGPRFRWERAKLRAVPPIVLKELLRQAFAAITAGKHMDKLNARTLDRAARLIRSDSTEPKQLDLSGGTALTIHARKVELTSIVF